MQNTVTGTVKKGWSIESGFKIFAWRERMWREEMEKRESFCV